MTVIRLNVSPESGRVRLHGTGQNPNPALRQAGQGEGPIVIMVHGYKYDPDDPVRCPQRLIFAGGHGAGWPRQLGLTGNGALGIAFGWRARGPLRQVFRTAGMLGAELARIVALLHHVAPHRPVHMIAHSMGSEVALSALAQAPAASVGRVILLTGASFACRALASLRSPAGRSAEVLNVVSRENDLFDFAFERMIRPPAPGSRVLGQGLAAANALTVQLDCPDTLAALHRLGCPIAASQRRICHWSGYTRPGAMAFYARLLHDPDALPLAMLRTSLPDRTAPRWARLSLGKALKTRMMPLDTIGTLNHERAN